jgi:hypothetical protein
MRSAYLPPCASIREKLPRHRFLRPLPSFKRDRARPTQDGSSGVKLARHTKSDIAEAQDPLPVKAG